MSGSLQVILRYQDKEVSMEIPCDLEGLSEMKPYSGVCPVQETISILDQELHIAANIKYGPRTKAEVLNTFFKPEVEFPSVVRLLVKELITKELK